MYFFLSLKKYKRLSETDNNKLKELYNSYSIENKEKIIKRADRIKKIAMASAAIYCVLFVAVAILFLALNLTAIVPMIFFAFALYYVYKFYCACTWNKVEPFEKLRLVNTSFLNLILNQQNKNNDVSIDI